MATFDTYVDSIESVRSNFKGYEGNPPTNAEEYAALDCWIDSSIAPAWVDIETALNLGEVQKQRASAYPSIAEQLDLLYHDIKSGALDSGNWIAAIEAVKTQYPKP